MLIADSVQALRCLGQLIAKSAEALFDLRDIHRARLLRFANLEHDLLGPRESRLANDNIIPNDGYPRESSQQRETRPCKGTVSETTGHKPWTKQLAGTTQRRRNVAERRRGLRADGRDRNQADDDDQGQHDGVFDCGWAVFGFEKSPNLLHERLHRNLHLLMCGERQLSGRERSPSRVARANALDQGKLCYFRPAVKSRRKTHHFELLSDFISHHALPEFTMRFARSHW
jgi:hypothetical protein